VARAKPTWSAFAGWEVTDVELADNDPDPIAKLLKFNERFYRLRRTSSESDGCP